jgi:hypothetical protein
MAGQHRARAIVVGVVAVALAGCAAGTTPSPSAISPPSPSIAVVSPIVVVSPSVDANPATPAPTPTAVAGWPTVSRGGVTITGKLVEEAPPFEGCPAPAPAATLEVTIGGLEPGESVSLVGTGTYDFERLGCGVQPSPCVWGSGTTDPTVHLCQPEYAQAVAGTAAPAAQATAGADGTAAATLRFVVSQSERACPAGPSLPWYVESGEWKLQVTEEEHGLRLVGPPGLVIGP